MSLPAPPVLVITDRQQARFPLEEVAEALFAGGCRWLSLREKDMPTAERLALLRRLVALGARWQVSVMIHDDLDAAAEAGTGVHLPADGSPTEARRRLGGAVLIGQSAHDADEVTRAAGAGVDYVTLSPVFITVSKPGYGPALGLDIFSRKWPIPVLALGGIDERNASACMRAGADGIAVMGEAMRVQDPQAFMAELLARMRANLVPDRGLSHS